MNGSPICPDPRAETHRLKIIDDLGGHSSSFNK